MKKMLIVALMAMLMWNCSRIDAGHEGMKVNLYGSKRGIDDVNFSYWLGLV